MSKVLKIVREFNQLSQTEVAEALGISKSNVSEYESGKRPLSLQIIKRYAKLFGVPPSSFLLFMEEIEGEFVPSEHKRLQRNAIKLLEWLRRKAQVPDDDGNSTTY